MARKSDHQAQIEFLRGAPDLLILRTLLLGPKHGHNIAHLIQQTSGDVLRVDHGSLYPALRRAAAVRAAVWGLDKDQPVSDVRTMEEVLSESLARQRFSTLLLSVFAGLATV